MTLKEALKFCNFPGGCMGCDDILAKGIDGALGDGVRKYKGHPWQP